MHLTRLELYKRTCDRPLSKIAPELGISGTVLSAICMWPVSDKVGSPRNDTPDILDPIELMKTDLFDL